MSPDAPLDPNVARYIQSMGKRSPLPHSKSGIKTLRKRLRASNPGEKLPLVEMAQIVSDSVAGRARPIPLRRYLPHDMEDGPQPAILFFHGGAWVAGDLESHDEICRLMADLCKIQVIAVDYRLAPEHPFPAAVEDAIDSYAMLQLRAQDWNIDPHCVSVMGDGTGGALATIVAIHARDMCQPVPLCQLLFYPVTNMAEESPSFQLHEGACSIPSDMFRWLNQQYLRGHGDLREWRVSPIHVDSMAGMPATFLAVGEKDPLHDEAVAYADRLFKSGVLTRLRVPPGQIYGYLSLGGVTEEAARSLGVAADFLKTCRDNAEANRIRRRNITV